MIRVSTDLISAIWIVGQLVSWSRGVGFYPSLVRLLQALKDIWKDSLKLAAVAAGVTDRGSGVVQDVIDEEQAGNLK